MAKSENIQKAFELAKAQYAELGVDVEEAMKKLEKFPISLHCWQADDVGGFESPDAGLSGGIQATGNYPGKARNIVEHRKDVEKAMDLIPGKQRLNLHAIYGDFKGEVVDRDQIETRHFQSWIDWAKELGIGIDFNCTAFSHPKADDNFTLSHKNQGNQRFLDRTYQKMQEDRCGYGKTTWDSQHSQYMDPGWFERYTSGQVYSPGIA